MLMQETLLEGNVTIKILHRVLSKYSLCHTVYIKSLSERNVNAGPKHARPSKTPAESCLTRVPTEKTSHVKCETPLQLDSIFQKKNKQKKKPLFSENGNIQRDGGGQVERRRKNGQTAVWQILWDVVEGWCCFHCWHQHKFSWCGSPCPAWAQHWETGEEILRATRERNQRAVAPRPLTHWTLHWPHHSLPFSRSFTHIVTCTEACCPNNSW